MADTAVAPEDVPQQQSTLSKLGGSERYWIWKAGLRAVICVINVVAIGCTAWIVANPTFFDVNPYIYYSQFQEAGVGSLVVLCISFVWCFCWILLPILLRPPRPLHPGIAVGFDLILWLGFIVIGLFTVAGIFSLAEFGSDPTDLEDPSYGYTGGYSGQYYLAPNNTWVYNVTYTPQNDRTWQYNETTGEYDYTDVDPTNVTRDCTPYFTSCDQQDAIINQLWHEKPRRQAVQIVINAVQWLDVLLHFALFVWACVDTHRRNANKISRTEQKVADRILADLEQRGLISVQNGTATYPTQMAQVPSSSIHTTATANREFYAPVADERQGHGNRVTAEI